jgi:S-formylglutathione hydrolase FrmB
LVAALAVTPAVRAEVRDVSFDSKSLGRKLTCHVQLPPSYAKSQGHYPLVVALHGLFEDSDFWQSRGLDRILDDQWAKAEVPELVLLACDGGNSFFVNSKLGRYEDLVTQDVVEFGEKEFRAGGTRASRALWGVSMGGYAALRIGLSHPAIFGAVATHSAMLLAAIPRAEDGASRWHMDAFHRVFGDPVDAALWAEADPLAWVARADKAGLPRFYFDCGDHDRFGLFRGNQEMHRRMDEKGIANDFAILPGDHGYEYVHTVLPRSLGFLGRFLAGKP